MNSFGAKLLLWPSLGKQHNYSGPHWVNNITAKASQSFSTKNFGIFVVLMSEILTKR